jgi:hypothetical protein
MRFPAHSRRSPFERALQRLRDGRPGESGYGRRIALLLTIPVFDDPVARDIRRATSGELYVVRTVWQRALDMPSRAHGRVGAPSFGLLGTSLPGRQPSLWSTRVSVDVEALDALLETVARAMLPCHPLRADAPLDATVFELTFGNDLHETRYRWSGDTPEGWAPLAAFTKRLVRLVDEPVGARPR